MLANYPSMVNIAAMPWREFEHLIATLFNKIFQSFGGEVHVTRSSRDYGVDAIAFDHDDLRGGKTIIQAKRYLDLKNGSPSSSILLANPPTEHSLSVFSP